MSALLLLLIAAGLADGFAQALRGWPAAATLAAASVALLAIGHDWALEVGLRGYTEPLLARGAPDTAAVLSAWALLLLLAQALPATARPASRSAARVLQALPSPPWLLALALLQGLLYQSIDVVPYTLIAAGLGLVSLALLALLGYCGTRDARRNWPGLLRPLAAAAVLLLSVWLGATGSAAPAIAVTVAVAVDGLLALAVLATVCALLGAVRWRRWL